MDQLQWVLNAAARLISNTGKYDHGLSQLLHDDLHWLDVLQQVQYKLVVTVHHCLRHQAPTLLADHYVPVSDVASCCQPLVINYLPCVSHSTLALVHWNSL